MSTSKQCRIYFHVYIESLLSLAHFTSIGSHNIDGDENSENKDHYSQTIIWLDQQARHFMDEQDEYHNEYYTCFYTGQLSACVVHVS